MKNRFYSDKQPSGGKGLCMVNTVKKRFGEDHLVGVQDGTSGKWNRHKENSLDYS